MCVTPIRDPLLLEMEKLEQAGELANGLEVERTYSEPVCCSEHPPSLRLVASSFRQLDLAPCDLFIWPHPLVNQLPHPGRSEALRRP